MGESKLAMAAYLYLLAKAQNGFWVPLNLHDAWITYCEDQSPSACEFLVKEAESMGFNPERFLM